MSAKEIEQASAEFDTAPKNAAQALQQLVQRQPKDLDARLALVATQLKLRDVTGAAQSAKAAAEIAPASLAAQVLLATASELANDLPVALAAWRAVATVDARSADAHEHIARLADLMGDVTLALEARQQLAQLLPGSPAVLTDLAVSLTRAKRHAEAVRLFQRADVLEPGYVAAHPAEQAAYQTSKLALGR